MKRKMKKRYVTPSAGVIRIQTTSIIASSESMGLDRTDAYGVSNVNEVLSREYAFDEE